MGLEPTPTKQGGTMLSLQEISDRFEIQDLCYRYADVIDQKRFDELQDIFEDSENSESTYMNLMISTGHKDPVLSCKMELLKQIQSVTELIDPWKSTLGGKQIILWLKNISIN